jgi:hypothetical protein
MWCWRCWECVDDDGGQPGRNIVGSSGGIAFLVAACATLFVGVQVMFEWREQEKREGIKMKC